MAAEIERQLGIVGHASLMGGTLTWSPAAQGEEARRLVVQVASHAGRTAVRIQEDLELAGIRKAAIPAGIMGGAGFGAICAGLVGMGEPAGPLLTALCGAMGAFIGVRSVIATDSMNRQPILQNLANTLAGMAAAARPAPALVGPGERDEPAP